MANNKSPVKYQDGSTQTTAYKGPGATDKAVYVQNTAPSTPPTTYVWVQTGLGAGSDWTLWFEDSL